MKEETKLESKAWWRLLKIIYITVYIASIGILALLSSAEKPYSFQSSSEVKVVCDNGSTYKATKPYSDQDNMSLVRSALQTCGGLYRIEPKVVSGGSWNAVYQSFCVGLLLVIGAIELVKTAFLYIIGVNWRRGVLYWLAKPEK